MKIARSSRYSRPDQGSTLIELTVGMAVGVVVLIALIQIVASFAGSPQMSQAALAHDRLRMDFAALEIRSESANSVRTFVFSGTLSNPDGTVYAGTQLTLATPVYAIADSSAFLSASGLAVNATTGADVNTIVSINDPNRPLMVTRESHVQADGQTGVSLTVADGKSPLRLTFAVPVTATASQLAAAKGTAYADADGHAVLIMPNPLASPLARLHTTTAGTRIDFPNAGSRLAP